MKQLFDNVHERRLFVSVLTETLNDYIGDKAKDAGNEQVIYVPPGLVLGLVKVYEETKDLNQEEE